MPEAPAQTHATVLIVDFGSQVTQLIARRVREAGVYSEVVPFGKADEAVRRLSPKAVILSGGPASVHRDASPQLSPAVVEAGVPVLGICYGQQGLVHHLNGQVEASDHREYGRAFVEVTEDSPLFGDIWPKGTRHQVWMSHGDRVTRLPEGFRAIASSDGAPFAVIADERRRFYGVQFHPEVVHTPDGSKLLSNFVHRIAGSPGTGHGAVPRRGGRAHP
jgi:GMP synthase (glutamine-hydrolysing)